MSETAPIRVHFKDGNWRVDGGSYAQGLYVTRRDAIKAGTYAARQQNRELMVDPWFSGPLAVESLAS